MPISPNTDNYVLGKGVVYFNELIGGIYQGERDLGNAPAFSFSVAVEKLEHYSSRGGLRAKDKEVISQITPSIAFTLDEINADNLGLLSLGTVDEITDAPVGVMEGPLVANFGMRNAFANRLIGTANLWKLTLSAGTQKVVVGETLTGGTSLGTFVVVFVPSTSTTASAGDIWVYVIDPTKPPTAAGEVYTGSAGGDPTTSAAVDHGSPLIVTDDDDATTVYDPWNTTAGTGDYWLNTNLKDDKAGRMLIVESPTNIAADGDPIYVGYYSVGGTYKQVKTFTKTTIDGFLRFVADNPVGTQQELKIWTVSLAPTGDTALIGDDWSTLGFTGEILKDETGHPNSPYMDINFM